MSEHSNMIHTLDLKYANEPVPCPNEGKPVKSQNGNNYTQHGRLTVHGSGVDLICGRCGYTQPAGRI